MSVSIHTYPYIYNIIHTYPYIHIPVSADIYIHACVCTGNVILTPTMFFLFIEYLSGFLALEWYMLARVDLFQAGIILVWGGVVGWGGVRCDAFG